MEYNISPSVLLGLKSNLDNEKDDDHQCCHSQLTTLHLSCQNTQINWNIYIYLQFKEFNPTPNNCTSKHQWQIMKIKLKIIIGIMKIIMYTLSPHSFRGKIDFCLSNFAKWNLFSFIRQRIGYRQFRHERKVSMAYEDINIFWWPCSVPSHRSEF